MSFTEFSTERVHNANCDAWHRLFGDDFYTEAANLAKDLITGMGWNLRTDRKEA